MTCDIGCSLDLSLELLQEGNERDVEDNESKNKGLESKDIGVKANEGGKDRAYFDLDTKKVKMPQRAFLGKGRAYLDLAGRMVLIKQGVGNSFMPLRFASFRITDRGRLKRIESVFLPWRPHREDAQHDLDIYAECRKWTLVEWTLVE